METKKQEQLKAYRELMLASRQKSLEFISGTDYRFQTIGNCNGCEIINDSRSSDIESTAISLDMVTNPLHLILDATNLESVVNHLQKQIKLKVVTLGVYGEFNQSLNAEICSWVDAFVYHQKLDDVVTSMVKRLKKGDTMLFSPASPGLDTYTNVAQRGEHFNKIILPHLN